MKKLILIRKNVDSICLLNFQQKAETESEEEEEDEASGSGSGSD